MYLKLGILAFAGLGAGAVIAKGTADPEPPDRAGGGAAVCDPGGGCGKGIWIGSVFSAGIRMIYLSGSLISD